MKEAHRLYYLAQARQTELKELALDFYRECIRDFEEEAKMVVFMMSFIWMIFQMTSKLILKNL